MPNLRERRTRPRVFRYYRNLNPSVFSFSPLIIISGNSAPDMSLTGRSLAEEYFRTICTWSEEGLANKREGIDGTRR